MTNLSDIYGRKRAERLIKTNNYPNFAEVAKEALEYMNLVVDRSVENPDTMFEKQPDVEFKYSTEEGLLTIIIGRKDSPWTAELCYFNNTSSAQVAIHTDAIGGTIFEELMDHCDDELMCVHDHYERRFDDYSVVCHVKGERESKTVFSSGRPRGRDDLDVRRGGNFPHVRGNSIDQDDREGFRNSHCRRCHR